MKKVLIIDDEKEVCHFLTYLLEEKGYQVVVGHSGKQFRQRIRERQYDLALIDVKLPDSNGLDILKELKEADPTCKTVVMTGYSTVKTAVEAIKLGANDYIEKPFDNLDALEQLLDELVRKNVTLQQHEMYHLAEELGFIIGENKEMNDLLTLTYKIAEKNVNVLIEGETGTGKEVLARFIHEASKRKDYPFIGVNCGAISETLLESELFGHEKGAFTGAYKERRGMFEIANKGTLFLDEIGEATLSTQVKLLRVLETGEYMRVGAETVQRTNTRILAATHVNLVEAVKQKTFREDLLYRLDIVKLTLPPLRKRREDIPHLIAHFLKRYAATSSFSEEAMQMMQQYEWPGNIRELANVVKRAVMFAEGETSIITPKYLPDKISRENLQIVGIEDEITATNEEDFEQQIHDWTAKLISTWQSSTNEKIELEELLESVKELEAYIGKAFVMKMLKETIGNRKEAAERLTISMRKLRYLLNEK